MSDAPHALHYDGDNADTKECCKQIADSAHASKPRGTMAGRIVRKMPLIGDIVKTLDRVSGDTTYGK